MNFLLGLLSWFSLGSLAGKIWNGLRIIKVGDIITFEMVLAIIVILITVSILKNEFYENRVKVSLLVLLILWTSTNLWISLPAGGLFFIVMTVPTIFHKKEKSKDDSDEEADDTGNSVADEKQVKSATVKKPEVPLTYKQALNRVKATLLEAGVPEETISNAEITLFDQLSEVEKPVVESALRTQDGSTVVKIHNAAASFFLLTSDKAIVENLRSVGDRITTDNVRNNSILESIQEALRNISL
ncbi:MAG: hypothetical protein KIG14_03085 [Candidatus Sacchiramonaceae bacterium]|nr:hypothetical protein [Candidatus Saccharimonadaceae bacterium]